MRRAAAAPAAAGAPVWTVFGVEEGSDGRRDGSLWPSNHPLTATGRRGLTDVAVYDFKGSCRRSVRTPHSGGRRPSPPCADEHMVWDLSDGRGLQNCPVRPCRLGVVSGGNEDHKQAPYPPPRPAHTQPKPLPIPAPVAAGRVATGAHKRSLTNATRATTARSGGLSAAPHPPDALGQPAPTLGGFTAASAPSAPPSPRAARAVAARPRGGP